MRVTDVLAPERVTVSCPGEGLVRDKPAALRRMAELLAAGHTQLSVDAVYRVLDEREQLQSIGVGEGIALPHGTVEQLDRQRGALLVCPQPIDFAALDGQPVAIVFGLVGPKGAPAEHLKVLAKVARVLRRAAFRRRSLGASCGAEVYHLIEQDQGASLG